MIIFVAERGSSVQRFNGGNGNGITPAQLELSLEFKAEVLRETCLHCGLVVPVTYWPIHFVLDCTANYPWPEGVK